MRTIARIITFSLQSIWRNLWLSFVTLTIFVLTLITVNAVLFLNMAASAAVTSVQDKVQVAVYFNPGTSETMERSVHDYLIGLSQVKTIDAITADEALAAFRDRHAADASVLAALDEVGGNPFGDALLISARSPEDFAFILEAVKRPEYVGSIKDTDYTNYQGVIDRLSAFVERIRWGGLGLAAFFTLISVLIIFNSIRVAIYVHRDEIAIMKLVGAHDGFVRAPFLLESVLISLLATVIVAVGVLVGSRAFDAPLARYLEVDVGIWEYFSTNAWAVFGAEFAVLAMLGLVTTYVAMRRHLRV